MSTNGYRCSRFVRIPADNFTDEMVVGTDVGPIANSANNDEVIYGTFDTNGIA